MKQILFSFSLNQKLRQPIGKLLLMLVCFLCGGNYLFSQTTWTGSVNTDWNTAANWSAGVPTSTTDATIANVTIKPIINVADAVAKSVGVNSGATLTIAAAGVLSINGSVQNGIGNNGTVNNNGTIIIGSISSGGNYGIVNVSTFNNNVGGYYPDR